jgi:hypothetical protein
MNEARNGSWPAPHHCYKLRHFTGIWELTTVIICSEQGTNGEVPVIGRGRCGRLLGVSKRTPERKLR